jgi:hypothetical protein
MRAFMFGLVTSLVTACGGGGGMVGDDVGDEGGTVEVTFSVTQTVRQSPNLVDDLQGLIIVGIFHAEDVTAAGPGDAVAAQYIQIDADLETSTTTPAMESMPLAAGRYEVLGFFDLDGNGLELMYPDAGDPVMLPGSPFTVEEGQTVTITADFDLVFN